MVLIEYKSINAYILIKQNAETTSADCLATSEGSRKP